MELNWPILLIAALVPLLVGAIYYNPKVFGNLWMRLSGTDDEKLKTGNMLVIYALAYLFGLFLAVTLMGMVFHQMSVFAVLEGSPGFGEKGSEVQNYFEEFMSQYGNNHRNLSHGLLHGGYAALTFALPIIAVNGMFERRGWKYIWLHFGYWFITLMIMGGLICHFL